MSAAPYHVLYYTNEHAKNPFLQRKILFELLNRDRQRELTYIAKCETFVHMKQIRIRDLHIKTGEWVRKAARGEGVVITERGRPMASLIPFDEGSLNRSFRDRQVLPEFDALPEVSGDAAVYISEDRDRS